MNLDSVLNATVDKLKTESCKDGDIPKRRSRLDAWQKKVRPRMADIRTWFANCADAIRSHGLACTLSAPMERLPGASEPGSLLIELTDLHLPTDGPPALLRHDPLVRTARLSCRLSPLTENLVLSVVVPGTPEKTTRYDLADVDRRLVEGAVSEYLNQAVHAG